MGIEEATGDGVRGMDDRSIFRRGLHRGGLRWALGIVCISRIGPTNEHSMPIAVRIALPIVMFAGATYGLVRPLLPDRALTNAKIEILRRDDAGVDLSRVDLSYVGPSITKEVKGAGKYVSVSRMEFTTDGRNQVRVLLIIDDARPIANTFLLPRSGDAVYRQSHEKWNEERTDARNSKLSLQLSSRDPDGITLQTKGPCCSSQAQSFAPYR